MTMTVQEAARDAVRVATEAAAKYDAETAATVPAITDEKRVQHAAALVGAEIPWTAVLMFEGVETGDGRIFEQVTHRDLPLPLMAQTILADGHEGAAIAGRIDTITKVGTNVLGTGVFDSGEFGLEIARLVEARTLRGISVDLGDVQQVEFEVRETDDDGFPIDVLARYTGIAILGATVLAHPAFAGAEIAVGTGSISPEQTDDSEMEPAAATARVASGSAPAPPAAWFDNPHLSCRSDIVITDEGRIFGHIYGWGECHIGNESVCMTAPPSESEYAYFTTGKIPTAEGTRVPTGPLVLDADHARLHGLSWLQARDHYAHTGLAVADVACGDDDYGIWVAGVVRPTATPEHLYVLQASALSGDWRRIGGHLELVAILVVSTPGFPAPRVLVASGEIQALVSPVGTLSPDHEDCGCGGNAALEARLDRLERVVAPLLPAAADALAANLDRGDARPALPRVS